MAKRKVLGDNDIDDVRWLCSLSEPELDLLMGFKNLVHLRAKKIGQEYLAKKFDLRMLRSLSFQCMEKLAARLKDSQVTPSLESNILKQNLTSSFESMTIEELYPFVCSDESKRIFDMFSLEMPVKKRKKEAQDT